MRDRDRLNRGVDDRLSVPSDRLRCRLALVVKAYPCCLVEARVDDRPVLVVEDAVDRKRARDDGRVGGGLEGDHDRSGLDRVGETLLDGEGENFDSDVLSLGVEGGIEDAKEISLHNRGADTETTKWDTRNQIRPSLLWREARRTSSLLRLREVVRVPDQLDHVDLALLDW
jgi:hypothetical protein